MLRYHSINAVHVMPFMCVTYRQIRFVWILVSPYCSAPHKQLLVFTTTHTRLTISSVEYHTRIKAWIELKEILSYYCPRSFETTLTCPMNVRFWGWLKPTKLNSVLYRCVWYVNIVSLLQTEYTMSEWPSQKFIWNWQDP